MKRSFRGFGVYIVIIVIFILVWQSLSSGSVNTSTYTYAQFEQAVEEDEVRFVQIRQNQQVPTGTLVVSLRTAAGSRWSFLM